MKKYVLFAIITILALFLQRVWVEHFPIFGAGPQFTLLIVAYLAVFHDPVRGVVVAFLLGYANDILFGYHPGLDATLYTLLFLGMYQAGKNFYLRSTLFQVVAAGGITLAYALAEFLMLTIFEVPFEVRIAILRTLHGALLINILTAPLVFRILLGIEDIATPSLLRSGGFGYGF